MDTETTSITPCGTTGDAHFMDMKKRNRSSPFALPIMMAQLTAASWETMFHRGLMMAQGTCSAMEYQRMAAEKAAAAQRAMLALMTGGTAEAVLAPYVTRARANAKRLRRTA